jgi:Na+-driven multidrug efflux pump
VGKVLISGLLATFGTAAIAAYSASYTINNIGWVIVSSFGTVMLPVVGQCVGAGKPEQAKLNMKKLTGAATVVLLVLFSGIYFFRDGLARLYDFEPETLKMTAYYTGAGALASIFSLYSFSFTPASGFRAAGDIRFTMLFSSGCMFVCRVGCSFVAYWIKPELGPLCIYIGMWADWAVRTVVYIVRFRSGRWIHKRLV